MTQSSTTGPQADDPELFKKLIRRPATAWPILALLASACLIFSFSTFAFLVLGLPLIWAMLLNAVASYMAFTVAHEATHSSVSSNQKVNDWAGRLAMVLLEPGPFFAVFRYIHMQHHKFTNDHEKDPDTYCGRGPAWLLPARWLTLDFVYFSNYLRSENFQKRPTREKREFALSILFMIAVITAMTLAGWLEYYLLLFFVPTRIAKLIIVIAFDFLPHHPHKITSKEDRYRCTSNRVGLEWLLTPLFIYQNYHLVHHLYPTVPFYRYLRIWEARRAHHESQNPATTGAFALAPRETEHR
jgi:fatty acid desaturase